MGQTATDIVNWAESKSLPDMSVILTYTANIPLPEAQRKLLSVMTLPETANLSVTEKCKVAQIPRPYYYEIIQKPEFQEQLARLSRRAFSYQVPKYAVKYSDVALSGDRQALERLLEQTGVLDPKESTVNITQREADADTKAKIKAGIESFFANMEVVECEVVDEEHVSVHGTEENGAECAAPGGVCAENGPDCADNGADNANQGPESVNPDTDTLHKCANNADTGPSCDDMACGGSGHADTGERGAESVARGPIDGDGGERAGRADDTASCQDPAPPSAGQDAPNGTQCVEET